MRGFTMMELLLAIVIFSVVVSLTYGAYSMTFKVINTASGNARYAERARVALDRIGDDLASIYSGDKLVFVGETEGAGNMRGDKLTFTSRAHLLLYKDDIPAPWTKIRYHVEEDNDRLRLYRADVPYLPGRDDDIEEERGFILCDGLREVAFTYYSENGNEADRWEVETGSSNAKDDLPVAVGVRLGFVSEKDEDDTIYYETRVFLPR